MLARRHGSTPRRAAKLFLRLPSLGLLDSLQPSATSNCARHGWISRGEGLGEDLLTLKRKSLRSSSKASVARVWRMDVDGNWSCLPHFSWVCHTPCPSPLRFSPLSLVCLSSFLSTLFDHPLSPFPCWIHFLSVPSAAHPNFHLAPPNTSTKSAYRPCPFASSPHSDLESPRCCLPVGLRFTAGLPAHLLRPSLTYDDLCALGSVFVVLL